ncbi:MAG: histidine kinase [Phycisphaerales bacterium]|nr:histidine kinase [Phycisphaerales bacterium]
MIPLRSISARLIVASALWIAGALAIVAVFLTTEFRNHVERAIDADLQDHISELLTLIVVDADGHARLVRHPVDPRFNEPVSGWYWEVRFAGGRTEGSRSLDGNAIEVEAEFQRAVVTFANGLGPRGMPLRIAGQSFLLHGANEPFAVLLAGPAADLAGAAREFATVLSVSLLVLAVGLVGAVFIQIRFGLRPLERMRARLAAMREGGREERMTGSYPTEVQPLADELNALLDHNAALLERARTQTGNLAHALKTPLAVVANEADAIDGEPAGVIREQTDLMADRINHFLSRARVAGSHGVLGARTRVKPVAEALSRTLGKIFAARGISVELAVAEQAAFSGEQQDLEELLGNLMENACKWAGTTVRVSARREAALVVLTIEDDGPGIPDDRLNEVLDRGKRLDIDVPGSGLGLAIVVEVVETYQGALELDRSPLGGLQATVRLPGA